jgi:hypothetical protein
MAKTQFGQAFRRSYRIHRAIHMVAARSDGLARIDPRDVVMRLRAEHFAMDLSDAELTGLVAAAAVKAGVTLRSRVETIAGASPG